MIKDIAQIKKSLDKAFKLISTIAVKDIDVDVMFSARQELRLAYAALSELEKEGETDGGQTD